MTRKNTLAAVAVCLMLGLPDSAPAGAPTEEDVKAAYLFNVLRFVQPKTAAPTGDMTVCFSSAAPIEQPFRTLENSLIQGRKLKVRTVAQDAEIQRCNVVFFGRSSGQSSRLLKAQAAGALTVGNDTEFLAMSGMLALVIEGHKVVVHINEQAAGAGWVISSHLLEVAKVFRGALR